RTQARATTSRSCGRARRGYPPQGIRDVARQQGVPAPETWLFGLAAGILLLQCDAVCACDRVQGVLTTRLRLRRTRKSQGICKFAYLYAGSHAMRANFLLQ